MEHFTYKTMIRRVLLLLTAVVLLTVLAVTSVFAETQNQTIEQGAEFTVQVGDTLCLTDVRTGSSDKQWHIEGNADRIVSVQSGNTGSAFAVKGLKPGTVEVNCIMLVNYYTQVPVPYYDASTNRWYTRYETQLQTDRHHCIATVYVVDTRTPKITKQPKGAAAASGKYVTLSVTAEDASDLSYRWYYKKVGASSFTKTSLTSSSFDYKMSKSRSGQQFYCLITDACGNRIKTKTVTVSTIEITKQPKSTAVDSGKKATVSANAAGSGLTYRWYYKMPGKTAYTRSSVTAKSYSLTMSKARSGCQVLCIVTDQYGNTMKTKAVTLRMRNHATIVTQPAFAVAASGKAVSTTVKASGDGLTYQWYYKNPGAASFRKASVTTDTFTCKMSKTVSGRQVYCIVKDKYGTQVKTKTVTLSLLAVTRQPENDYVEKGQKASVSTTATGSGLTYRWYCKDPGASSYTKTNITSKTYTAVITGKNDGRRVYCLIKDKFGNYVKTKSVTLNIQATAKIFTQPKNAGAAKGEVVSVSVRAEGPGLTYRWYAKNPGASSFVKTSVTASVYKMTMTEARSGRQVYCIVTDKYGNSVRSNTVTLKVPVYAKITKQPASSQVYLGESCATTISARGDGLTYRWYLKKPGASSFAKSSYTSKTLRFTMTEAKSGMQAYCLISDWYGNTVKSKTVTLSKIPPVQYSHSTSSGDMTYQLRVGDSITVSYDLSEAMAEKYNKALWVMDENSVVKLSELGQYQEPANWWGAKSKGPFTVTALKPGTVTIELQYLYSGSGSTNYRCKCGTITIEVVQ